ncbi:MAG: hypothetical protein PHV16_03385 [Candidatus Nanoarchaeia archaeon]|nr:hypothetical protein [Candidatus Nanoarchaeia archaeon]
MENINENKKRIAEFLIVLAILISLIHFSSAAPVGPVITSISNETGQGRPGTLINTTGGSITTVEFNVTSQNMKWKAFVGNVSGKIVLSDSMNYSVYDWALSFPSGEVYATRSSNLISWGSITCSNLTHIQKEEVEISHISNPADNISATFNEKNHDEFHVGTVKINEDQCFSVNTNVNSQQQDSEFQEVLLYDGTDHQNGNIVYATMLEQNTAGYNYRHFDFQMIVPENGLPAWTSATPYYFYVELT